MLTLLSLQLFPLLYCQNNFSVPVCVNSLLLLQQQENLSYTKTPAKTINGRRARIFCNRQVTAHKLQDFRKSKECTLGLVLGPLVHDGREWSLKTRIGCLSLPLQSNLTHCKFHFPKKNQNGFFFFLWKGFFSGLWRKLNVRSVWFSGMFWAWSKERFVKKKKGNWRSL